MVYFCSACSAVPRVIFWHSKTRFIHPYSLDIQTNQAVFVRNIRGTLFRTLRFTGAGHPDQSLRWVI